MPSAKDILIAAEADIGASFQWSRRSSEPFNIDPSDLPAYGISLNRTGSEYVSMNSNQRFIDANLELTIWASPPLYGFPNRQDGEVSMQDTAELAIRVLTKPNSTLDRHVLVFLSETVDIEHDSGGARFSRADITLSLRYID